MAQGNTHLKPLETEAHVLADKINQIVVGALLAANTNAVDPAGIPAQIDRNGVGAGVRRALEAKCHMREEREGGRGQREERGGENRAVERTGGGREPTARPAGAGRRGRREAVSTPGGLSTSAPSLLPAFITIVAGWYVMKVMGGEVQLTRVAASYLVQLSLELLLFFEDSSAVVCFLPSLVWLAKILTRTLLRRNWLRSDCSRKVWLLFHQ